MILYTVTYCLSIASLHLDRVNNRFRKIAFVIINALLIVIAGSKDAQTCPDTQNYINSYENARLISEIQDVDLFYTEPGFEFLMSMCRSLGLNYTAFFYLIATLTIVIYAFCFWKYSPRPFLSLFIFISIAYITQVVVIIRYGLATAVMFYALIDYSRKGKVSNLLFLSLAASLFHYTAFSIISLLPFLLFKIKRNNYIRLLAVSFVLSVFNVTLLLVVEKIINYLPTYLSYAISKGLQYVGEQGEGTLTQIILLIPFFWLILKKIPTSNPKTEVFDKFLVWLMLSVFLHIQFSQAEELARISVMYMSILYILIPLMFAHLNKDYSKLLYCYTIIYCIARFVRISYFNSGLPIYVI